VSGVQVFDPESEASKMANIIKESGPQHSSHAEPSVPGSVSGVQHVIHPDAAVAQMSSMPTLSQTIVMDEDCNKRLCKGVNPEMDVNIPTVTEVHREGGE
jgi:hypothetical protein